MEFKTVLTTCPYCAVGCNMLLQVLDGEIVGTLPSKTGPSNEGRLCIKGWTVHEFIQYQDRHHPAAAEKRLPENHLLGPGPGFLGRGT